MEDIIKKKRHLSSTILITRITTSSTKTWSTSCWMLSHQNTTLWCNQFHHLMFQQAFSILRQNYNLNKKHVWSHCTNVKMKENLHFPLILSIQHHARNFVSINGIFRNLNLELATIVTRKAIGKENFPWNILKICMNNMNESWLKYKTFNKRVCTHKRRELALMVMTLKN